MTGSDPVIDDLVFEAEILSILRAEAWASLSRRTYPGVRAVDAISLRGWPPDTVLVVDVVKGGGKRISVEWELWKDDLLVPSLGEPRHAGWIATLILDNSFD